MSESHATVQLLLPPAWGDLAGIKLKQHATNTSFEHKRMTQELTSSHTTAMALHALLSSWLLPDAATAAPVSIMVLHAAAPRTNTPPAAKHTGHPVACCRQGMACAATQPCHTHTKQPPETAYNMLRRSARLMVPAGLLKGVNHWLSSHTPHYRTRCPRTPTQALHYLTPTTQGAGTAAA
jgi:hypothetical protein